jgi:hypothetical protein
MSLSITKIFIIYEEIQFLFYALVSGDLINSDRKKMICFGSYILKLKTFFSFINENGFLIDHYIVGVIITDD